MNFKKISEELEANAQDILTVHKILKDGFIAKSVDILFYDESKKAFFDKINKTRIYTKFLNSSSIIGSAYMQRKRFFIEDTTACQPYHTALDNPFKLDTNNMLIIPSLQNGEITGFIRILGLEHFSQEELQESVELDGAFAKVFAHTETIKEDEKIHDNAFVDRMKIFTTISQMKKLYNVLSENARNQEVEKLIEEGRTNLENIYTYLNPNFEHVVRIQQERQNIDSTQETKLNLLIADDLKINVQILKSMLSVDAIIDKIKLAYDGVEAVEVLQECHDSEDHIHIIFLDHHMPGRSGTEIAHEIKKEKGDKQVVIVSITNDKEVIEKHKDVYDYHLPKPFTKDNVAKIMAKIKDQKRLVYKGAEK
jgi:CheY-like chemotaxis protein